MLVFNQSLERKIDLLLLLTRKEIALKYKRTILGILWSLLNPILLALVFFVAFKVFMRFKVENYTFFLLSALFPWSWFASSVIISARSLVDNVTLIKKVIFPRHYLVAAVVFAQLIHLIFSIPVLLILSYGTLQGPSLSWFLGVPILILIQLIFTFGICLIVSVCNTYFRDIEYLVAFFMNLLFWMTPITYPLDAVPVKLHALLLLNPLAGIMLAWRELLLNNQIMWKMILISLGTGIVSVYVGILVFRTLEKKLDEVL